MPGAAGWDFVLLDRGAGALCTSAMRELSREGLRSCCVSTAWVSVVAERQPYRDLDELRRAGEAAMAALSWPDVLEALAAHPRIGARATGDSRAAAWSDGRPAAGQAVERPVSA